MSRWLLRLAVLLLAVAVYGEATDVRRWSEFVNLRGLPAPVDISPTGAKAIGVIVWVMIVLLGAHLLSVLRGSSPTLYSVVVILGSVLIVGYFAMHFERGMASGPLAGLGGGSLGALDGLLMFRQRRHGSVAASE